MWKLFKKNKKSEHVPTPFEVAQNSYSAPKMKINESLAVTYLKDRENIKQRFEQLNDSYNQFLKVEVNRKKAHTLAEKVSPVPRHVKKIISKKKKYKLSKVKASPNKNLVFDINNIDQYFYDAIHRISSKHIIENQIENELMDIRMQMAHTKSHLNFDKRRFEDQLPQIIKDESSMHKTAPKVRDQKEILEDVFSELDSMLKEDKAYVIDGKASIIRSRRTDTGNENHLKKVIKNIRV